MKPATFSVFVAVNIAIFQSAFAPTAANAQPTKLQSQRYDYSDPCQSDPPLALNIRIALKTTSEMRACAISAANNAPPNFFVYRVQWIEAAAEHYDFDSAYDLADMYARRNPLLFNRKAVGLPPKNLVVAYIWAEIGARLKGKYVSRLPAQNSSRDDNSVNLKQRDEIARHMTLGQIQFAQNRAEQWIASHSSDINAHVTWAATCEDPCLDEPPLQRIRQLK
jgi:hypothetical protein